MLYLQWMKCRGENFNWEHLSPENHLLNNWWLFICVSERNHCKTIREKSSQLIFHSSFRSLSLFACCRQRAYCSMTNLSTKPGLRRGFVSFSAVHHTTPGALQKQSVLPARLAGFGACPWTPLVGSHCHLFPPWCVCIPENTSSSGVQLTEVCDNISRFLNMTKTPLPTSSTWGSWFASLPGCEPGRIWIVMTGDQALLTGLVWIVKREELNKGQINLVRPWSLSHEGSISWKKKER